MRSVATAYTSIYITQPFVSLNVVGIATYTEKQNRWDSSILNYQDWNVQTIKNIFFKTAYISEYRKIAVDNIFFSMLYVHNIYIPLSQTCSSCRFKV